ncbi:membrane protein insertion efficiency factor YidD [Candidatus Kuenenbacteria bacterium]|nr:membrane protein insertion efficiency factor YidD [Candidatus Kuenenbacteria bacterium]
MTLNIKYFPRKLAIFIIKIYQKTLSFDHGFLGKIIKPQGQCRFYPTCSDYAIQSIKKYGLFKGFLFSFKRVFRCHPLSSGGYDPVK